MVKFAHMSDVHLGGWKQQELQDLNFKSFQKAIEICINEKLDFVLIAGDLFDTAFPSIEILKKSFSEFKKLNDAGIPCFFIAGSHDYSVSGKTFLDVLENTGFCKNVENFDIINDELILNPTNYNGISFYGYPGKKTGLEIKELRNMKINDSPLFKILMLHTTIDKALGAMGDLPIDSVEADSIPQVDYCALGHLHIDFKYKNMVYPGPVFPNNFAELEKLNCGSFYIVDADIKDKSYTLEKKTLDLKKVESISFEIKNAVTATDYVISELGKKELSDKIVLLRFKGYLENSRVSNIDFKKIENYVMQRDAYFVLRNTHELREKQEEVEFDFEEENIEEETMKKFAEKNPSKFREFVEQLLHSLSTEKQEGETSDEFSKRITAEAKKVLKI